MGCSFDGGVGLGRRLLDRGYGGGSGLLGPLSTLKGAGLGGVITKAANELCDVQVVLGWLYPGDPIDVGQQLQLQNVHLLNGHTTDAGVVGVGIVHVVAQLGRHSDGGDGEAMNVTECEWDASALHIPIQVDDGD